VEIKDFYEKEEFLELFKKAIQKNMSKNDPFKNRAYLVIKELPDAKIGTVLKPVLNKNGEPSTKPEYKDKYSYPSECVGRRSFLHREIVENKDTWFIRIN